MAWANHAGDGLPILSVVVESADGSGAGTDAIRRKLVELHDELLGVQVTPHSPDVEGAYRLFVNAMERMRDAERGWFNHGDCLRHDPDRAYFDGILDDVVVEYEEEDGYRWPGFDWDRVGPFMDGIDFDDPYHAAQAWVVVLAYLMTDYRYLYL